MTQQLTITPINALLSDKQLLNARVQYQAFAQYQVPTDTANRDLLHTGIVTATHNHPVHGLMVRIQPDENTLDLVAAWYVLKLHVTGWAVMGGEEIPAPVAPVVVEQPTAEAPVIETPAIAAQAAHMTDAHRYQGVVGNVYGSYGYINDINGGDVHVLSRNVLGGVALVKGMRVTYTTSEYTTTALSIVVSDDPRSVAAYDRVMAQKEAKRAAEQPAKDRAALRKARYAADLKVRAEREKADMAALAAKLNATLA